MAILTECPICHRKQSIKNKKCSCGADMDAEKRKKKRVKYYIVYRVNGKQRWELVGFSINEARDANGKRRSQKRENRIFDILPEAKMTFEELSEWYLGLETVKQLASFKTIKGYLKKFNGEFVSMKVCDIKLSDLENLQVKRKREGLKPKTIDDEISYAKTMIIKAFNNDKVGGNTLKTFQRVKRQLNNKNANARDRVLSGDEYESILRNSPKHLKDILVIAYWTGMRKGEILNLTWDKVNLKDRIISLEAVDTKEGKAKTVPIGDRLYEVLSRIPRSIHDSHVFLYCGRPIGHFTTALKTACEEAGVTWGREVKDGFTFHDIRHTFVTDMRKAGVSKSVRMSITGHAPKDMDDRYNRVDDNDKLQAISQLEADRGNVRQESQKNQNVR